MIGKPPLPSESETLALLTTMLPRTLAGHHPPTPLDLISFKGLNGVGYTQAKCKKRNKPEPLSFDGVKKEGSVEPQTEKAAENREGNSCTLREVFL
jgi:hypothetical protein